MKLLFISSLYPKYKDSELLNLTKNFSLQDAPNVYQWAVVDGLIQNHIDFKILSYPILPSYPFGMNAMRVPSYVLDKENSSLGVSRPYNSLAVFKSYSISSDIKRSIIGWMSHNTADDLCYVLVYNTTSYLINPVIELKKKYSNLRLAVIVTDLVDNMMDFRSNHSLLKRIQCRNEYKQVHKAYSGIDKYILLSKPMEEKIHEAIGKNIVIEGIYSPQQNTIVPQPSVAKNLLYTGSLEKFAGVKQLVDAFLKTKGKDLKLDICGSGAMADYIKAKAEEDSRIIFHGRVTRCMALKMQKEAKFLINPRQPNGGITKYSFPSKTMEYLASGTPMIGYMLEGFPEEYKQHIYSPSSLSLDALTKCIEQCLNKDNTEIQKHALMAQAFILREKTSRRQIARLIEFLNYNKK